MAQIALINPRKRRKSRKTHSKRRRHVARRRKTTVVRRRRRRVVARRAKNPRRRRHAVAHRVRRYKRSRNPRLSLASLKSALIPGAVGAAGAVGLDLVLGYVGDKLPTFFESGLARTAVKVAGAMLLGTVAGKVVGAEKGKAVMLGGLTVVLYGALRDALKNAAPQLPLNGFAAVDYESSVVGAYQPPIGYMSPAPFLNGLQDVGAYQPSDGM